MMTTHSVGPFFGALTRWKERLTEISSTNAKVLGYFCTYTPLELIYAMGFVPVRILGRSDSVAKADGLTPHFICPYLRGAMAGAVEGDYAFVSGIVQGYTCDVACGVTKIWEENIPTEICLTIPLPYHGTPESRQFFKASLQDLVAKLESIGGAYTDESLDNALGLYSEIRRGVLHLYDLRCKGALNLSGREFFAVIQAAFLVLPQEYRDMIAQLVKDTPQGNASRDRGTPVLVSGSVVDDARYFDIIEESGGAIVADDLCTGVRNFVPPDGEGATPMDRLIDRYVNRSPCPARSRNDRRVAHVMEWIERSDAKGVVFLFQKFCTPHLADHPTLAAELKNRGVPSIAVEMEETGINEGRVRTRLEAFFEVL